MNLDGSINVTLVEGCDLPPPHRATDGSAGFDLRSRIAATLPAGEWVMLPTGFVWEIQEGSVGMVCPRSGLALKHGVTVLNAPGIVDSDYRGEVCVLLINHSFDQFRINVGDRIAQMVVVPVKALLTMAHMTAGLRETGRGGCGFGSTGVA